MTKSITKSIRIDCAECSSGCTGPLGKLNPAAREILQSGKRSKVVAKNQVLFNEGDIAQGFFEIRAGVVRTCRLSAGVKEHTFEMFRAGERVGLRDSLLNGPYMHSCVSVQETEVCFFDKSVLKKIFAADPEFQTHVMEYLATRWCASENKEHSIGTKNVHGLVAELLLSMRSKTKSDDLHLDFTREIMASMLGTSTETIIRALSDFKSRGWCQTNGTYLKLTDLRSLQKMAELEPEVTGVAV